MKWIYLLLLVVIAVAQDESSEESQELPLALPCDAEACQLPDCRCSSTNIPGGLNARDTPQFVMVTFDDNVNVLNMETYRDILYDRTNINGCTAGATFYINHEYNSYQFANELYNRGFEIALHSITHVTNQTYWASATYEDMMKEFGDQRVQMAHFANIPIDSLKGIRIPFLQMTGNASFQVMADVGLQYDSTWPTQNFMNPGMWPYTLDYASTQDCFIPPCPTASIPGTWELPMISWLDLQGVPCSMADACFWTPDPEDEEAWFNLILTNFERHYLGNRAPFGYFVHEWFIRSQPALLRALVRFMDLINGLNDVFMVNAHEVIDWVKDPVPVNEYLEKPCRSVTPTNCPATTCELPADHNPWSTYWMAICNECPRVYPWLGNPLGL